MALTEKVKGRMIKDLQDNVDFEYEGWDPNIKVWRAGEGHERKLPYVAVDYIETSTPLFKSMSDIVGRIDDLRYEHAFCELELVDITVYAAKYHKNKIIRGRDFASEIIQRIRKRILAYWNNILYHFNASVDRGGAYPIKDLSRFRDDVTTRIYEYNLNIFLRTDVRWHKDIESLVEERAEKAFIVLNNKNNIRINTS